MTTDGDDRARRSAGSDVRQLLERHLTFARSVTPPEDAHALDLEATRPGAVLRLRADGELLAIGALRHLDDEHAEVKSMHTVEAARGRGIGRAMLDHLLGVARERGYRRVSLETGAMAAFAPARSLYLNAGFEPTEPFGDYRASRNSVYLTLVLDEACDVTIRRARTEDDAGLQAVDVAAWSAGGAGRSARPDRVVLRPGADRATCSWRTAAGSSAT